MEAVGFLRNVNEFEEEDSEDSMNDGRQERIKKLLEPLPDPFEQNLQERIRILQQPLPVLDEETSSLEECHTDQEVKPSELKEKRLKALQEELSLPENDAFMAEFTENEITQTKKEVVNEDTSSLESFRGYTEDMIKEDLTQQYTNSNLGLQGAQIEKINIQQKEGRQAELLQSTVVFKWPKFAKADNLNEQEKEQSAKEFNDQYKPNDDPAQDSSCLNTEKPQIKSRRKILKPRYGKKSVGLRTLVPTDIGNDNLELDHSGIDVNNIDMNDSMAKYIFNTSNTEQICNTFESQVSNIKPDTNKQNVNKLTNCESNNGDGNITKCETVIKDKSYAHSQKIKTPVLVTYSDSESEMDISNIAPTTNESVLKQPGREGQIQPLIENIEDITNVSNDKSSNNPLESGLNTVILENCDCQEDKCKCMMKDNLNQQNNTIPETRNCIGTITENDVQAKKVSSPIIQPVKSTEKKTMNQSKNNDSDYSIPDELLEEDPELPMLGHNAIKAQDSKIHNRIAHGLVKILPPILRKPNKSKALVDHVENDLPKSSENKAKVSPNDRRRYKQLEKRVKNNSNPKNQDQVTWTSHSLIDTNKKSAATSEDIDNEINKQTTNKESVITDSLIDLEKILGTEIPVVFSSDTSEKLNDETFIDSYMTSPTRGVWQNVQEVFDDDVELYNLEKDQSSFHRQPLVIDSTDESSDLNLIISDEDINIFNTSLILQERLPIIKDILKCVVHWSSEKNFAMLQKLHEKIKPGIMSSEGRPDQATYENAINNMKLDNQANKILDLHYQGENFVSVHATPDHNCFWNSVAIHQVADEAYKYESKLGATCKMITDKYDTTKIVKDKEKLALTEIQLEELSDHDYMNEIRICAEDGAWAGPYQIAAASIYLNTRINIVYPPIDGKSDPMLNGEFGKEEWTEDSNPRKIDILFSKFNSQEIETSNQVYQPNHYTPLFYILDASNDPSKEKIPIGKFSNYIYSKMVIFLFNHFIP